jgi:hypothetical protein
LRCMFLDVPFLSSFRLRHSVFAIRSSFPYPIHSIVVTIISIRVSSVAIVSFHLRSSSTVVFDSFSVRSCLLSSFEPIFSVSLICVRVFVSVFVITKFVLLSSSALVTSQAILGAVPDPSSPPEHLPVAGLCSARLPPPCALVRLPFPGRACTCLPLPRRVYSAVGRVSTHDCCSSAPLHPQCQIAFQVSVLAPLSAFS